MLRFNGFLLLEMPQRTWSACLDRARGRKEDGRQEREGWGVKNNFVQAPLVHFVIEVHRDRKKMLWPPSCGISC